MAKYCPICFKAIGSFNKDKLIEHLTNHYHKRNDEIIENLALKLQTKLMEVN